MGKKDFVDEKTGIYIPTYEEMGITEAEVMKRSNEWYQAQVDKWQAQYLKKEAKRAVTKKVNQIEKIRTHWFNILPNSKVETLATESSLIVDEVIDNMINRSTLPSMKDYYQKLRLRVKNGRPRYAPAKDSKLLSFPYYNPSEEKLFGSDYSFCKFWSHVYPSARTLAGHAMYRERY